MIISHYRGTLRSQWIFLGTFLAAALVPSRPLPATPMLVANASISTQQLGKVTCPATGPSTASCSEAYSIAFGEGAIDLSGNSSATAGYGILHAGSSVLASCPGVVAPYNCYDNDAVSASAAASFSDSFSVKGGPSSGFLDFRLLVSGSSAKACTGVYKSDICGNSAAQGVLSAAGYALINGIDTANYILGSGTTVVNVLVPLSGTGPTDVQLFLRADVFCGTADYTTCQANADYLDTAYVTDLSVLDTDEKHVVGAAITDASGTDYNHVQTSSVPEPSLSVLWTLGLLMIVGPKVVRASAIFRCSPFGRTAKVPNEEFPASSLLRQ